MRAESASMTELTHPNDQWGLQVCVFSGEVTFTIPYWDDFDSALAEAQRTATKIAEQFDLGCYDPQDGSANY